MLKRLAARVSPRRTIDGYVDGFAHGRLAGWARDPKRPDRRVPVTVLEGSRVVATGVADRFRVDLKDASIGDGRHAFSIRIDKAISRDRALRLTVVESESGAPLGSYTIPANPGRRRPALSVVRGTTPADSAPAGARAREASAASRPRADEPVPAPLPPAGLGARHYRSLCAQLRRAADGRLFGPALGALRTAHDSVREGPADRASYPRLRLAPVTEPLVSVVIPAHDQYAMTHHCLASIVMNESDVPCEVILVDDRSTDRTASIEEDVENLIVVRNERNLRFLRSAAAGAARARGDYIVFLNNDTEVTHGWIEELLGVFDRFADVGMSGSKLVYPDGRLQEAGGIVWGNGRPWNVGNGEDPDEPVFNYVREVDYLSGAALMIRRDVWRRVGGFSEEFAPAYYEDTDLAFKVREAGYRTLYCPSSVVIHHEGASNGKSLDSGVKRHQALNAPKFRAKWRHAYRHNGVEGMENLRREMDRGVDFRVLVIDQQYPRPDQDAGSYAAVNEMTLLQELGCRLTFLPRNMLPADGYVQRLQERGIECVHRPFYPSASDFIAERGAEFDAVYVTRYEVAEELLPAIRAHTGAKILFNNADLHFLRELRTALAGGEADLDEASRTRERELEVMRQVDVILSYSEIEHSVIASHNLRQDNVFRCPWVLDCRRSEVGFEERAGIAFLGGFGHLPNVEAVIRFVADVMPALVERMPDVRLHVYGSAVPPEIESLASEHVIVEGFVEDLSSVFDTCRVFVAPLISGAGIKGKVLESMSRGVPSVLSPIAAEATGLAHDASALIVEDPADWAAQIERLYRDEALWRRLADGAAELARRRYSRARGLDLMSRALAHVELEPARRRQPLFKTERGEI